MGKVIKYKCTRCDYVLEQYDNVKAVYHPCPQRKKYEVVVLMEPMETPDE